MIQGSWFTPWRLPRSAGQASTAQADGRSHGTVRERRHGKSGRRHWWRSSDTRRRRYLPATAALAPRSR